MFNKKKEPPIDIDLVESYMLIESKRKGAGWFLWVFWLIVFWPFIIVVIICHLLSPTYYNVAIKLTDGSIVYRWLSTEDYQTLQLKVNGYI